MKFNYQIEFLGNSKILVEKHNKNAWEYYEDHIAVMLEDYASGPVYWIDRDAPFKPILHWSTLF